MYLISIILITNTMFENITAISECLSTKRTIIIHINIA